MTERVRVGVIGAGAIAQVAHLPVLSRLEGAVVTGLCDNDLGKARSLGERFGVRAVFDDIEDLLQSTEPDAVVICTPNHLHEIHVKTALSAGAHVLCERPIALSADGARQVVAAQVAADRCVMVGMNYRFRTDVQAVRVFLQRKELGRVHAVRCGWYTFRPSRQALGWRRRRAQSGGGAVLDLGLGLIDLSLWLMGRPAPCAVTATFAPTAEGQVENSGCVLIACADGMSILVDVSWSWIGDAERFWFGVHGADGSALIAPLRVYKELQGSVVDVTPTGASGHENAFTASYVAQWAHFLAVARGHLPAPDLEPQVGLHRLLDAVYQSAREGHTVTL